MSKKEKPFNNPFYDASKALKKKMKKEIKEAKKRLPEKPIAPKTQKNDENLFAKAFADIAPKAPDERGRVTPTLPPPNAKHLVLPNEDAETLAELASLIDGTGRFDISDSDEFIEGCAEGLDRRILRKLRAGDYAFGSHLDLHGLTRDQAYNEVIKFIDKARTQRNRCILIVHGKGINSKDNIPVLKGLLRTWLQRGRISRSVLAFCTARPHDGGAGAVYVLLRR